jgi:hypothetical protein
MTIDARRTDHMNDLDRAFDWRNGFKGLFVGAFLGGFAGLGVCMWIIEGTWLFPGDTILIGAVVCGILGFLFGQRFFDWLSDWWHWFF